MTRTTDRLRTFYDRAARSYDRWLGYFERWMRVSDSRHRLLGLAHGATLDVGAGTGLSFAHYPATVRLTGIDLSSAMLELAQRRSARLGIEVDLRLGDVEAMPFGDGQFDTVTATYALSVVAEPRRAVDEIWRVLKPGGRLLVLDQVSSHLAGIRWLQWMIDPLLVRYAGWHIGRDLVRILTSRGFTVERRRERLGTHDELVCRKPA